MFIELFSDHVYEEQHWPAVFRLESMILGVVLEDYRGLKLLSVEGIKDHIRRCLDAFGIHHGMLEKPSHAWMDAFLDREAPFVREVVVEQPSSADLSHRDPRLALNEKRLQDCMTHSDVFRTYVLSFRSDTSGM